MKQYLYPKNLRAKANLWLWGLKDFMLSSALGPSKSKSKVKEE